MAAVVLAGCSGTPSSPAADSTTAPEPEPATSAAPAPEGAAPDDEATGDAGPDDAAAPDDTEADTSDDPSASAETSTAPSASPSPTALPDVEDTSPGDDSSPALEMPEAPEPTVTSLSDLLEQVDTSPLVRSPLPRASSREGLLVAQYPPLLRPVRSTRVESSGLSPSGDRLQVSLVATTSLGPDQVLLGYRTRLALRGLVEQAAPPATPGSTAAAFRRGRSVVTLTVTPEGSGTSYSILASLHTGGS